MSGAKDKQAVFAGVHHERSDGATTDRPTEPEAYLPPRGATQRLARIVRTTLVRFAGVKRNQNPT
jgi:hypothetical protein